MKYLLFLFLLLLVSSCASRAPTPQEPIVVQPTSLEFNTTKIKADPQGFSALMVDTAGFVEPAHTQEAMDETLSRGLDGHVANMELTKIELVNSSQEFGIVIYYTADGRQFKRIYRFTRDAAGQAKYDQLLSFFRK